MGEESHLAVTGGTFCIPEDGQEFTVSHHNTWPILTKGVLLHKKLNEWLYIIVAATWPPWIGRSWKLVCKKYNDCPSLYIKLCGLPV